MKKPMNSGILLLVDGENLLHRSYHKFLNFKSTDGVPTGAIYGFFKSLHSAIFRFSINSVVVIFDNGRSKYRTELWPNYKGNRTKLGMDYESLQSQKKSIRRLLGLLSIPVVYDKEKLNNYECDDYIALLSGLYGGKVMILSSDKDFCQLIDNRVKLINPSKDTVITTHNCKEVMDYEPSECVDYLSLTGDNSDNIPGIKGMGPKKARVFLDSYGSIKKYLELDTNGINKVIKDQAPLLKHLIDLKYFITKHPLKVSQLPIKYGKSINYRRLNAIFTRLSMSSLKSNEFYSIFKTLKVWKIKR